MTKSLENKSSGVIYNKRVFSATPQQIFAAFEDPEKLARWWGPAGFSNTFDLCEFKPGGRWLYLMHGPDGRDYANECVFREIEPFERIVIEHVVLPLYKLTIKLAEHDDGTHLSWEQEFENRAFETSLRSFLENANNENLARLEAVLTESVALRQNECSRGFRPT